jgi:hypothetical protein
LAAERIEEGTKEAPGVQPESKGFFGSQEANSFVTPLYASFWYDSVAERIEEEETKEAPGGQAEARRTAALDPF